MFDEMMRIRRRGKYSPHESNYTRLFGTPERAARTIVDRELGYRLMKCEDYNALLAWLKGGAE